MKNKNSRFCIFLLYLTKVGVFHAVDLSAQFRNRVSFGEVWNKSGLMHSLDCLGTWNLPASSSKHWYRCVCSHLGYTVCCHKQLPWKGSQKTLLMNEKKNNCCFQIIKNKVGK